ncbi:ribokinase-like domain-containing protein [Candidatus Magnetobacterium bavaricum]|uniref:Ribokinase-like domain-containing protein n=1 Tax=Candidatus Magnetobacterium bavaricum TaxID=29290 RepID=A0A0F3GK48_9BACT|nr:ribokinase-like domain-containing protein [Candidatus Magnetobacterium bavaricum]
MKDMEISKWIELPPQPVIKPVDTSGAGDWCSTGLLFSLLNTSNAGKRLFDRDELIAALQYGQALAAISCLFVGAQGLIYEETPLPNNNSPVVNELIRAKRRKVVYEITQENMSNICSLCLLPFSHKPS